MAISSPGIGSGLDVKDIVSKLVALEQTPLTKLQTQATTFETKLSAYGQLKSQLANLQTQAAKLAAPATWSVLSLRSGSTAITGTANSTTASVGSYSVQVTQLARAQSAGSSLLTATEAVGEGTLKIDIGTWSGTSFTSAGGSTLSVDVGATDTLADVASKINAAGAGVTATALKDSSGQYSLMLQSSATGEAAAFRVQAFDATDTRITTETGLARMAFDVEAGSFFGMDRSADQTALNAKIKVNGIEVSSATNKFTDSIPGVTLNVTATTDAAAGISVVKDTATMKASLEAFVSSYNALSNALAEMTKYNAADKSAGTLQGDSTAVGLLTAMKRMVGGLGPADSGFSRLSDVGIQMQLDGTLKIDADALNESLANPDGLKSFFTAASSNTSAGGLGTRMNTFLQGLLDSDGTITSKTKSLQSTLTRNAKEQEKIQDRIERVEARLLAQYSRLDTTLSKLGALNDYVAQQITTWNKQGDN